MTTSIIPLTPLQIQAIRLKRTDWSDNVQALADEMFMILENSGSPPGATTASVAPTPGNPAPTPITIPPIDFPPIPPIDILPIAGGLPPPTPVPNPTPDPTPGQETTSVTQTKYERAMVPGLVTEDNGDGTYKVTLFVNGVEDQDNAFVATVKQLDGKAGTTVGWALVSAIVKYQVKTTTVRAKPSGAMLSVNTEIKVVAQRYSFQPSGGGGGGVPAVITGGSGSKYDIDVYEQGPSATDKNGEAIKTSVTGTQLQIDPNETIPPGTWTVATKVNGRWWFQVPVWL